MRVEVSNLFFSYKDSEVLKGIDFKANDGELIALLGPNGSGKTTFIRCLLGFLEPKAGEIKINDKLINLYSKKALAGEIAYIPQYYHPAFNHTVLESIVMGLSSQIKLFEVPGKEVECIAMNVLDELGISFLANRGSQKISGGEKQLMLLARALVQNAHILIMDEPTASLDFGNSFKVMKKIKDLSGKGYTIIFSTHDPNLALRYSTRIIGLKDGKLIADGDPGIITSELIRELYGVDAGICSECGGVVLK